MLKVFSIFLLISINIFSMDNVLVHPTEVIVARKNGFQFNKSTSAFVKSVKTLKSSKNGVVELLELVAPLNTKSLSHELRLNPGVEWTAPNRIFLGDPREFLSNDEFFPQQDAHQIIKTSEAWSVDLGKEDVVVAVTDDGFELEHEDLKDCWYRNRDEIAGNGIDDDGNGFIDDHLGWDFNTPDNDPNSDYANGDHGTHVAGIIGACFNNGSGIAGMGPTIKVMPLKFYGSGNLTSAMFFSSYTYAVDNGAKVISTSYGIDWLVKDKAYLEALKYARDHEVLVVNSAGNNYRQAPTRTKIYDVMLVGSTDISDNERDKKSNFSNYGKGVDIFAPGRDIFSTVRDRSGLYKRMSGTSMAAPRVAGLAALLLSSNPDLSLEQLVSLIYLSSDDIDWVNPTRTDLMGNGRINAYKAIKGELRQTSVRKVWTEKKILNIHLKGIISRKYMSRIKVTALSNTGREIKTLKMLNQDLGVGSNILKFDLSGLERGEYKVKVNGSDFIDPFGRELDVDGDKVAGGKLLVSLTL